MIVVVENKRNQYLIFFVVLLFFLPRINLVSIGSGHTAGLRIDDIILFLAFISIILKSVLFKLKTDRSHIYFFSFVFLLFISFFLNFTLPETYLGSPSILYPLRYIEYFIFFVVGTMISNENNFLKIIFYISIYQISIILFQYYGILPAFTSTDGISYNIAAGTTGGPWEVSIVLALCYAIYINHFSKLRYSLYFILISLILSFNYIYILGSRSSTFAFVVLFSIAIFLIIKNFCHKNFLRKMTVAFLIFLSSITFFTFNSISKNNENIILYNDCEYSIEQINCNKNILQSRSSNLLKVDNYYLLVDFYKFVRQNVHQDKIPIGKLYNNELSSGKRENLSFSKTQNVDLSWLMRMEKWVYGISLWQDRLPLSFFFGIGPGTTGPSFDGNWIRLLVENGIIALILIILLFMYAIKTNLYNFLPIIVMSISMIFIDAFMAYKSVSLFLFILGYYIFSKKNNYKNR